MNQRMHLVVGLLAAVAAVLAFATPSSAQVRVIISGGFTPPYQEVLPAFERTTGIKVTTMPGMSQGNGPTVIAAQLRRGVLADVVIMSREGLDGLIAERRVVAGSDVNLAQTPLGLAVRAGAPQPDISTVDAFKATLLRAKVVAFMPSTTGIYLTTTLFPRLGIAEAIAKKSNITGAAAVAKGDAELTLQPVSELLHVAGIDYVTTVPTDVQYVSVFSAAVVAGSKEMNASKQLIAYLASDTVTAAIKKSGMERPKRPSTR
jgi:molybdate transport system substrate-binding protein